MFNGFAVLLLTFSSTITTFWIFGVVFVAIVGAGVDITLASVDGLTVDFVVVLGLGESEVDEGFVDVPPSKADIGDIVKSSKS